MLSTYISAHLEYDQVLARDFCIALHTGDEATMYSASQLDNAITDNFLEHPVKIVEPK